MKKGCAEMGGEGRRENTEEGENVRGTLCKDILECLDWRDNVISGDTRLDLPEVNEERVGIETK